VAVIGSSALTPLPLLSVVLHTLVQAYSMGMVRANDSLCLAPLMTDPLTVQRIHTFHSSMHLLALLLPGKSLPPASLQNHTVSPWPNAAKASSWPAFWLTTH
jgi:hypothetical protein